MKPPAAVWLFLLLWLAGCTAASDEPLRIATEHSRAGTQMVALRTTATVSYARLITTMDFSQTQVAFAATQSQFLKATLAATGFAMADLEAFQQAVSEGRIVLPTATPVPQSTAAAGRQMTQSALSGAATAPAPADPAAPRLENVVLATGVQNDCATGITTQFTTTTPEIYVVGRGFNLPAGTQVAARWRIAGQDVSFDFVTAGPTSGECLWFYIDQTDFAFTAGTWDVTLSLNGTPATPPISFSITAGG
ncbi:MAG: hypothetical protein MUE40_09615 [Anaerolineae bacterium]|nr:hypothetical protein [Anaerolineae bacterium]